MKDQTKAVLNTIKTKWEDDPIAVTMAGAIALGAVTKLINAVGSYRSRRAYSKQVMRLLKGKK